MKKTQTKQYKAVIERDEDGIYVASVPALPGCHTQGRNLEELRLRLREAIELCFEHAQQDARYRSIVMDMAYDPTFVGFETVTL